jgi:hypothetical protein
MTDYTMELLGCKGCGEEIGRFRTSLSASDDRADESFSGPARQRFDPARQNLLRLLSHLPADQHDGQVRRERDIGHSGRSVNRPGFLFQFGARGVHGRIAFQNR